MKFNNLGGGWVVMALVVVVGCSPARIRKEIVIDQVIKEAGKRCQQVVRNNPNVFERIDVVRQGDDTVLLEYVLKPQAEVQVDQIHQEYMDTLENDASARKDFQRIADEGIQVRLIYKSQSGQTLDDFLLNPDTLK